MSKFIRKADIESSSLLNNAFDIHRLAACVMFLPWKMEHGMSQSRCLPISAHNDFNECAHLQTSARTTLMFHFPRSRYVYGYTVKQPDGHAPPARAQGAGLQGILQILIWTTDCSRSEADAVSQFSNHIIKIRQ